MSDLGEKLMVHQRIGFVGLSIMLIMITAFSSFSMDMFSPSIPTITEEFDAPETAVTLTITVFFIFYSLGMLLLGPVSDKFGRKPVLVLSLALYVAGSFLCAVSSNLPMLIGLRIVQAIGAGGAMAVGTAILNDVFAPEPREKFLMIMAVFQVIGPVLAPIVGAYIAMYSTWHVVFVVLGIIGIVCLAFALLFNETLPEEKRLHEGVFKSYTHMVPLLKDRAFMTFMVATVMPGAAFGALLAVGSYIYIDIFGQSETVYGYFFAAIAVLGMCGPLIYNAVVGKVKRRKILEVLMFLPFLACVLELLFGHVGPFVFTACFLPVIFGSAAIRPAMTSILLQQSDDDAGSASGLINFSNTIAGALGMVVSSLFSFDFITGVAVAAGIAGAVSAICWAIFCKQGLELKGL